jgi:large subunit ribosomal protein L9
MKVLFLKDVARVGQRGSIREVADGYALNLLIPRGFAVQATSEKVAAHVAAEKKEQEKRERENQALAAVVHSLENARIEILARATEKGGLFKAITVTDIKRAIADQKKVDISEETIQLSKPFKEIGEHRLTVKAAGAEAHLMLAILASKG